MPVGSTRPTADSTANEEIEKLTGEECDGSGDGQCLDVLAEYLYETDLSDVHEKSQNIKSHWIGFGKDVAGSALLQHAVIDGVLVRTQKTLAFHHAADGAGTLLQASAACQRLGFRVIGRIPQVHGDEAGLISWRELPDAGAG